jgi:hypothetical protein
MKDIVAKLLNSQEGILMIIVSVMIGTNILLTSLRKCLGWIKDKTETHADNKAYDLIVKVLSYSDKALEFMSANSTALPAKAKAELARASGSLSLRQNPFLKRRKSPSERHCHLDLSSADSAHVLHGTLRACVCWASEWIKIRP